MSDTESTLLFTPDQGRIKINTNMSEPLQTPLQNVSSQNFGDQSISHASSGSSSLLRLVQEKNLQLNANSSVSGQRSSSAALLRQYSCMEGVPDIEGLRETETPPTAIDVKSIIELITRPTRPPTRIPKPSTRKPEGSVKLSLRVHLLDNSYRLVSTYKKSTGLEFLFQCAAVIGCESPEYFGISFLTPEGIDRWIDFNLTLEASGLEEGDNVWFKIKYYKLPAFKLDDISLQLFLAQAKNSILSGSYIVPERLALLLAAFQLQIFYGNYDPNESWIQGLESNLTEVLPSDLIKAAPPSQWASRIIQHYQQLYDLTASEATYGYLTISRKIPACCAAFFPVIQGKLNVTIGISEAGIMFFKDDKKSMFEFFVFDDLLGWTNSESGIALRLQKRQSPQSSETFQIRVTYDCSPNQALTIIDLLEGYTYLIGKRADRAPQQTLISPGLRPISSPFYYVLPIHKSQDEPFGTKLDFFLHTYRISCANNSTNTFTPLLKILDNLNFPGSLSKLDLSDTSLDIPGSVSLLQSFDSASKFKSSVGDAAVVYNLELEELNLSHNRVSPQLLSIPQYITSLTRLDLSSNGFLKDDFSLLASAFKSSNYLKELKLANNELNDKFLTQLLPTLSKCSNLELLDLSHNSIKGVNVLSDLGKLMKLLPQFRKLKLHDNKLHDNAVDILVQSVECNGNPPQPLPSYEFDLRNNATSTKSIAALTNMMKRDKTIGILRLSGSNLNSSHAAMFADAMKEDVNILVLDVGNAAFGKRGWTDFYTGLAKQSSSSSYEATGGLDKSGWSGLRFFMREVGTRVSHFAFEKCDINPSAMSSFNDFASGNSIFIDTLLLKGADFGKKDFPAFAEILTTATSILHLDLTACKISDSYVSNLSAALKANTVLSSLKLDSNPISDVGVEELAESLKKNATLESISLQRTNLTSECIPSWASCVSVNCGLQLIDLSNNGIKIDTATVRLLRSVPCTAEILF